MIQEKQQVLFLCSHNAVRSQMAEGFLRSPYGDQYEAFSAGVTPSQLHFLAVKTMGEIGIDISDRSTRSVYDLHSSGCHYDYVITGCDEASSKKCPTFNRTCRNLHWSF